MPDRYTYQSALAASEVIHWRIEDIIGGDKRLDFNKAFMPESLAHTEPLTFLTDDEKRIFNQIRGNAYLCIFGLVVRVYFTVHFGPCAPATTGRRLPLGTGMTHEKVLETLAWLTPSARRRVESISPAYC